MTRPKQVNAWKVRIWIRGAGVINTLSTHEPTQDSVQRLNGIWKLTFPEGLEDEGDQIGSLDWSEVVAMTWRPPGRGKD